MNEAANWNEAEEAAVLAEVLDTLVARFPAVRRAQVALAIDTFWPRMDEIEATLIALNGKNSYIQLPSLDFTQVCTNQASTPAHPR